MSAQLQLRRNIWSALAAFIGAQGEIVFDTTNNRAVVHDGVTAGGFPAAKLAEVVLNSVDDGIEAHPGGAQADATPLLATINRVMTVANAGDSVALQLSSAAPFQIVINGAANAVEVFGNPGGTDTLNGQEAGLGVSVPAGKIAFFLSPAPGVFVSGVLS